MLAYRAIVSGSIKYNKRLLLGFLSNCHLCLEIDKIKPKPKFVSGILKNTLGTYDINPWASLNLDHISTFMDYYTVVIMPGQMNYSVDYGSDSTNFSAICEHGKELFSMIFFRGSFMARTFSAIRQFRKTTFFNIL